MNPNDIKKFLESVRDTDIEELEFETGNTSVHFIKREVMKKVESPKKVVVEKSPVVPIKSTMVGTFYSSSAHDRPPFVVEGSNIEAGQKIGAIEAMKIIKDIFATTKGKIVKICVKNGQSVEYGQELFLVDTSENA